MNILNIILYGIDCIGHQGPLLLLGLSTYLLWRKPFYLSFYLTGWVCNVIINILLKGFIQQPRPSEDLHVFRAEKEHIKRMGFDRYGMPSGHAQMAFYSVGFLYFVFQNTFLLISTAILSIITNYQRVKYKNHTVMQVIVGSLVGFFVGYVFYILSKKNKMGILRLKKDDSAPI
jgi:membrane-associated phospholipid phosphatase